MAARQIQEDWLREFCYAPVLLETFVDSEHFIGEEKVEQHYVYVLESVVILDNGITLPLLSEFLAGQDMVSDPDMSSTEENPVTIDAKKQDCERKAFRRLAAKIKEFFRNTLISIVVDGLYACGPVIQLCARNKWGYMIVLKPDALRAVWDDALGIMMLDKDNRLRVTWGNRTQDYAWANDIEYEYRINIYKYLVSVHYAFCVCESFFAAKLF